MFFLFIFSFDSGSLSAQTLQKLYSGLDNATSLSVTPNSVYIVEQGKNRLLKLDLSGKLLETIGGKGSGNYHFSKPEDVDATNGLKIYVTDYNNRRVQVFDRRGQYLSSIIARQNFGNSNRYEPAQISVNSLGEVFFTDESANEIYHFDMNTSPLDAFRIPSEIGSVDEFIVSGQQIYILDIETETIHRLALNGSFLGFYPAEGVKALFVNERKFWRAFARKIEIEEPSKEVKTINFDNDEEITPVDIHVHDEVIFLLTAESLFKISSE